ncbi:hypothetical protein BGW39_003799 [Mortierella sp. 14UC]|nr:hypothetical protein BGW39_003799 [Mortierella sp. 14UC]
MVNDILEFLGETSLRSFNPTTFTGEPKVITSRGDYRLELQGESSFYPNHYILAVHSNSNANKAVAMCYVHKNTPAQHATSVVAALEGSADDYYSNNRFRTDYVIGDDGIAIQVHLGR